MIGDRVDRLIVKALVVLGYPFDAWFLPADANVRKAMRGEYQAPEWFERPAAVDAAGMSEGAASTFPPVPAPSRPDWDQILAVTELYAHHQPKWDSPSTIKCTGCRHTCHSERRHWRHVTELATDMVTTSYRIQQLLNK